MKAQFGFFRKTTQVFLAAAVLVMGGFIVSNSAQAATANITKLAVTTSQQSIFAGDVSAAITVQTQNSGSTAEQLDTSGTALDLSSTSTTGEFSSSATTWTPVTSITMNSGTANRTFYYKDTTPGTYTITVTAEGQTWIAATQTITIKPLITNSEGESYTTIQAAVTGTSDGGTITVPAGTYSLTSELDITKALTINGTGNVTLMANNASWSSSNKHMLGLFAGTPGTPLTLSNLTVDCNSQCYGLNTYYNAYVNLNDVTIKNSRGAGLTVNGSTVVASNLNTSGNSWGAVNVDPGSGVTDPSVFTLNSGTLGESTQIWSDGGNVNALSGATVTVNATGYTQYLIASTTAFYIWSNSTPKGATIAGDSTNTLYSTIQAAVDAATSGDTIEVGPGTYNESVNITRPMVIRGAQTGVTGANSSSVQRTGDESTVTGEITITSSDVVIDGFRFTNAGSQVDVTGSTTLSGVVVENNIFDGYDSVGLPTYNAGNIIVESNFFTNPSSSAEPMQIKASDLSLQGCSGTQVSNNVFHLATTNGAADINFSCTDSESANITVSGNISSGLSNGQGASFTALSGIDDGISITNNTVSGSEGSAIFFFGNVSGSALIDGNSITDGASNAISIHGHDFTSDAVNSGTFTITNNTLTGNDKGVSIASGSLLNSAQVLVHNNIISGNSTAAIANATTVDVDAADNWWGQSTGPDASSLVGVSYPSTWCEDENCNTTRSFNAFVDHNGNTTYDTGEYTAMTISDALTHASAGDTVVIFGGNYPESILINTSVNLKGFVDGSGNPYATLEGDGTHNYVIKLDGATDVTIDGLGVNGGGSAAGDNSLDYGIWINNSGTSADPVTVKNSSVKNIWQNGSTGIEIDATASSSPSYVLITSNKISSFHKRGIRFINSQGIVSGNEITGDHVDGTTRVQNLVNLWGGSTVEVANNTLHNGMSTTPGTWDSPAVFVSSYGGDSDSNANIHDNTIYDVDTGITAGSYYAATDNSIITATNNIFHDVHQAINLEKTTVTVTAHENSFGSNVTLGLNSDDGNGGPSAPLATVDATNNWWGSASGPANATNNPGATGASVYDNVSFNPWYLNSNKTVLSNAISSGGGVVSTGGDFDIEGSGSGQANIPTGVTNITLGNNTSLDLSSGVQTQAPVQVTVGGNSVDLTQSVVLNSGTASQPIVITNSNLNSASVFIPDATTIQGPTAWDGKITPPVAGTPSGTPPAGFSVGNAVISVGSSTGTLVFDKPVKIVLTGVTGVVGYRPAGSTVWQLINTICNAVDDASNISSPNECYFTLGTDTVIWTYHFTSFASLTSNVTSGGGGGGGGAAFVPTPTPAPVTTPGVVLGTTTWANGTLVKTAGSATVYMAVNNVLRPFNAAAVFVARGLKFSDIQVITDDQLNASTVGKIIGYPDGTLIKGSAATVFVVSGDTKQGIPSMTVFNKHKFSLKKIVTVSDSDLANYDDGTIVQ